MASGRSLTEDRQWLTCYTSLFTGSLEAGCTPIDAAVLVAELYLDAKPRQRGKRKSTSAERDAAFWSSGFLMNLPAEAWHTESLVLALTRYMSQERMSNLALLERIAAVAPEALRRAIRYSGLVLRQHSLRCKEIDRIAAIAPAELGEIVRVLDVFARAYHERLADVGILKQRLAELKPLDLLVYASLFAFEHLVPRDVLLPDQPVDLDANTQYVWDAINDLLIWKIRAAGEHSLRLTESTIAKSLAEHLMPFLFPSYSESPPRDDLYGAFRQLLAAQIELNSFISRSAEAFSYDDSITFVQRGDRLEILELDPVAHAAWERNGERLASLEHYWVNRALDAFATSDMATAIIGKPENHEANRFAYIMAIRTLLRLTEVYGLSESVTTPSGLRVDLFQALLSMELMSVFFSSEFILPYIQYLSETGNAHLALGQLAFDGLMQPGSHNRFPLTWSDRAEKIANITSWTVSKDCPHGNPKAAEAILDFWTSDWTAMASKPHQGESEHRPELFECPILKMGRYLFQLPWVVGIQNISSAAINNLRRIGARRKEARDETRRIENRLAERLGETGFRVQLNYLPGRTAEMDPGEVDIICARDGQVLVLEIKSTFLRCSKREVWLHGTTTLRKAGFQLYRKLQAVKNGLTTDAGLLAALGLEPDPMPPSVRGWIVDTSIEHDHERFNGFLKVSLEEILIALRDDRHLLNSCGEVLKDTRVQAGRCCTADCEKPSTLYPDGFNATRFFEVIESAAIWDDVGTC